MKVLCSLAMMLSLALPTNAVTQQNSSENKDGGSQMVKLLLREGTEVYLKLAQDVNSRTAKPDEPVELVLDEPVKVGEITIASAGSRSIGFVVHSAKPDFWGNPGELSLRLSFLKVGKTKVPLRGAKGDVGSFRGIVRGGQAVIKQGTPVKGYVDQDTEIEVPQPSGGSAITAPASSEERDAESVRLPNGTPLRLALKEPLSSKTASPGDAVNLSVVDDVKVENLMVIAAGSPAKGTIVEAKAAGRAWRKGQMGIQLDSVTLIDQQPVALEYATQVSGPPTNAAFEWTNAIVQSYGLLLFALPFAPLQHGNQAILRRGTILEADTKGEILLPRSQLEALQPKPFDGHGPAAVTFYFPAFEQAGFHQLWIGDVKLGDLKKGRNFHCQLPAGRYSFRVRKKARSEVVDLEAGKDYYVRMGFLQALGGPGRDATGLTKVDYEVGRIEAIDTRPAESKSMPGLGQLNTSTFQCGTSIQ